MASRSALVVATLATGALVLSGCGGGGGGDVKPKACTNNLFDLKTQSYSAQVTLDQTTTPDGKEPIKISASGTESQKLDMENINIREDVTIEQTVPVQGKDEKVKVDLKAYLSVDKKTAAFSLDVSIDGTESVKNCSYIDLSAIKSFPPKEVIAAGLKAAVSFMAQKMKCTENDGTYDTFVLNQTLPPKEFPMPKDMPKITGEISETIKLTTDYMLHSVNSQIDLTTAAEKINGTNRTLPAQKSSQKTELTVTGDKATPKGPTDDDLDYTKWGETCTEIKPTLFSEISSSAVLQNMVPELKVRLPNSQAALLLTVIDQAQQQSESESMSTVVV